MNSKKQKLLLEYLLSSSDTFALCHGILQSDYFDPEFRNTVEFIFDYYEQFSSTPTPKQVEAETNLSLELYDILGNDEIGYCSAEVEKFCKRRKIRFSLSICFHVAVKNISGQDLFSIRQNRSIFFRLFGYFA